MKTIGGGNERDKKNHHTCCVKMLFQRYRPLRQATRDKREDNVDKVLKNRKLIFGIHVFTKHQLTYNYVSKIHGFFISYLAPSPCPSPSPFLFPSLCPSPSPYLYSVEGIQRLDGRLQNGDRHPVNSLKLIVGKLDQT